MNETLPEKLTSPWQRSDLFFQKVATRKDVFYNPGTWRCPLFLALAPPKKGLVQSKRRVIWVPGYYIFIALWRLPSSFIMDNPWMGYVAKTRDL